MRTRERLGRDRPNRSLVGTCMVAVLVELWLPIRNVSRPVVAGDFAERIVALTRPLRRERSGPLRRERSERLRREWFADGVSVVEVRRRFRQQEYVLMRLRWPVGDRFRHRIRLVPDDVRTQVPAVGA